MAHRLAAVLAAPMLLALVHTGRADTRLGVVAPRADDSYAVLGEQLRQGIDAYQATAGKPFDAVVEADETCDAASGIRAARKMVAAKVDAVVGFYCIESLEAALPILSEAKIATIGTSVRADIVMEDAQKRNWPFFRLAPSSGAEVDRIVDVISHRWAGAPFAIVEDGTIYGRELAEEVRVALKTIGVTPAFTDTYRPVQDKQFGLAHRLERAGVTRVFVGGERSDIAIIARDSAAIGLKLTFLGGDAMKDADGDVPLEDGVEAVIVPPASTLDGARQAATALKARGQPPYGDRLDGYAAAQIVDQAAARAEKDDKPLVSALAGGSFDTALGTVRFGKDHERSDNPFELMVWQDDRFVPVESGGKPG